MNEEKKISYNLKILKVICDRYNQRASRGYFRPEDLAIGTTVRTMDPSLVEEINRDRPNPLKPSSIERSMRDLKREGYLEPVPNNSSLYLPTDKAFEVVGIERVKPISGISLKKPLDIPRDKIHRNIECRVCLIVDGYLPEEKECRHCGSPLLELDAI